MKKSYSFFGRRSLRTIAIVVGSMSLAFAVGIQTAGDVKPVVSPIHAGGAALDGDLNGNGMLDIGDARAAMEIANGYRSPTPDELASDPNHDLQINGDDVLSILDRLERAPQTPRVDL